MALYLGDYYGQVTEDRINIIRFCELWQEVKVEKIGERFQVKIKSVKGENNLVNILEAFEEMGLSVAQARASCLDSFAMEAIVAPQSKDKLWSVDDLTQTLVKALVKPSAPL